MRGVMIQERYRISLIQIWLYRTFAIFCCLLVCSCSFSIFNWRKTKSDSIKTTKSSRVKQNASPLKQKADATWSEASSGSASRRVASAQESDNLKTSKSHKNESNDDSNQKTEVRNDTSKKIAKRKQEDSNLGPGAPGTLGTFEKFDHVEYRSKIKSKAIDIVNHHKKCSLARLCKDFYTEQWSLRIYRQSSKTYSFISYAWDPIAEEWNKDFKSPSRPNSTWKRNLKSSAAGKECDSCDARRNVVGSGVEIGLVKNPGRSHCMSM